MLGAGVDRTGLIPAVLPFAALSLLAYSEAEGLEEFFFSATEMFLFREDPIIM